MSPVLNMGKSIGVCTLSAGVDALCEWAFSSMFCGVETLDVLCAGAVAGILRPVAGWVGDHPRVNRLYMVGGSGIFCGVVAGVSIPFNTFPLMIVYAILAGIGGGTYRRSPDNSGFLFSIGRLLL